jgi:hypothetical protein
VIGYNILYYWKISLPLPRVKEDGRLEIRRILVIRHHGGRNFFIIISNDGLCYSPYSATYYQSHICWLLS